MFLDISIVWGILLWIEIFRSPFQEDCRARASRWADHGEGVGQCVAVEMALAGACGDPTGRTHSFHRGLLLGGFSFSGAAVGVYAGALVSAVAY